MKPFNYNKEESLELLFSCIEDDLVVMSMHRRANNPLSETSHKSFKSKTFKNIPNHTVANMQQAILNRSSVTNDWYCLTCHKPGNLIGCDSCSVAFHEECLFKPDSWNQLASGGGQQWTCDVCKEVEAEPDEVFYEALVKMISNLNKKNKDLVEKPTQRLCINYDQFVYQEYNFSLLLQDCIDKKVVSVNAFKRKLQLIKHNCSLAFGAEHTRTAVIDKMVESIQDEISDLDHCVRCYHNSRYSLNDDWLGAACSNTHHIGWLREKQTYYPVMIMQSTATHHRVMHFDRRRTKGGPMSEWVYHKTILFACPFLVVSKQKAPPQLWLCTVKRALEYATNSLPEEVTLDPISLLKKLLTPQGRLSLTIRPTSAAPTEVLRERLNELPNHNN